MQAHRKPDELLTALYADWKPACSTGRLYPTGRPSSFRSRRSGLQKSSGCGTKSKIVPVYGMRTYGWSRSIAPSILNLGTRWRWVVTVMNRPLYSWDWIAIFLNQRLGGGGGGGGGEGGRGRCSRCGEERDRNNSNNNRPVYSAPVCYRQS